MTDMKTSEDYFRDWEAFAFGFGYGSGEPHTIPAVKKFLGAIGRDDSVSAYDYERLEESCGAVTAWLLINILCRVDIIEYGTSPRYGWLTKSGIALKEFADQKSDDELIEICTAGKEGHVYCYPDYCNCDGDKCRNPFWA